MPKAVADMLADRALAIAARLLLTFAFWCSGIMELLDFPGNAAAMAGHGLTPGWAFNVATISLQLGASLMIVCNRGTWLAAGALGIFTVLTIPIAHAFWRERGGGGRIPRCDHRDGASFPAGRPRARRNRLARSRDDRGRTDEVSGSFVSSGNECGSADGGCESLAQSHIGSSGQG